MTPPRVARILSAAAAALALGAGASAGTLSPEGDCGPTTITQSTSQTITDFNSISCQAPVGPPGVHVENSYWRAFDLPEHGVFGPFNVCAVEFGVEYAQSAGAAGQPLTVRVWDQYDRAFGTTQNRVLLGSAPITLSDQALTIESVEIPTTAPAYGQLVVEIHVPDGTAAGNIFFPGSNTANELAPGYTSAASCDRPNPVTFASLGFPEIRLVINVIGAVVPLEPVSLAVGLTPGYIVKVNDTFPVSPVWENTAAGAVTMTGTLAALVGVGGLTITVADDVADYGSLTPGVPGGCGANCYAVQVSGGRPLGHVDLTMGETLDFVGPALPDTVVGPAKDWRLHVGGSFFDVPDTSLFFPFVENVFHHGITGGCGPTTSYCPDDETLRKQMAVFVLKAFEGPTYFPPPATGIFHDVPAADPFAPWIEELSNRGVVAGCNAPGGPNYCPEAPVLRQQMAVFLLKTLEGSGYNPPACTQPAIFADVPCPGPFTNWIEEVYDRGITGGCVASPLQYCPGGAVTRKQMAPFLVKTFGLQLYGP